MLEPVLKDLDIVIFIVDLEEFKVSIMGDVVFDSDGRRVVFVTAAIINLISPSLTPHMGVCPFQRGFTTRGKPRMTEKRPHQTSAVDIVLRTFPSS